MCVFLLYSCDTCKKEEEDTIYFFSCCCCEHENKLAREALEKEVDSMGDIFANHIHKFMPENAGAEAAHTTTAIRAT